LFGCSAADAGPTPRGSGASANGGSGGTEQEPAGGSGGSSAGGGSGSPTTGGAPGSGGTTQPADAGGDVGFEWPETVPGTGQCKPGLYEGEFQCTYTDPSGGGGVPVSGPISVRLVESASGELLEVRDGVLDGTANALFIFRADVVGKLDCYKATFNGRLVNGTYSGFAIVNGTFEGPLGSTYDHQAVALTSGTWQLTVAASGGGCNGTWSARYVSP
jgi:hypothetical protein